MADPTRGEADYIKLNPWKQKEAALKAQKKAEEEAKAKAEAERLAKEKEKRKWKPPKRTGAPEISPMKWKFGGFSSYVPPPKKKPEPVQKPVEVPEVETPEQEDKPPPEPEKEEPDTTKTYKQPTYVSNNPWKKKDKVATPTKRQDSTQLGSGTVSIGNNSNIVRPRLRSKGADDALAVISKSRMLRKAAEATATNTMRESTKSVKSEEKVKPKSNFANLHGMLNKAFGLQSAEEEEAPKKPVPIPKSKKNGNFAAMHAMLEGQFGGKKETPKSEKKEEPRKIKKGVAAKLMAKLIGGKKLKILPPGDPGYEKYEKMKKRGLPEGAIRNCLERDGFDPEGFFNPKPIDSTTVAPKATKKEPEVQQQQQQQQMMPQGQQQMQMQPNQMMQQQPNGMMMNNPQGFQYQNPQMMQPQNFAYNMPPQQQPMAYQNMQMPPQGQYQQMPPQGQYQQMPYQGQYQQMPYQGQYQQMPPQQMPPQQMPPQQMHPQQRQRQQMPPQPQQQPYPQSQQQMQQQPPPPNYHAQYNQAPLPQGPPPQAPASVASSYAGHALLSSSRSVYSTHSQEPPRRRQQGNTGPRRVGRPNNSYDDLAFYKSSNSLQRSRRRNQNYRRSPDGEGSTSFKNSNPRYAGNTGKRRAKTPRQPRGPPPGSVVSSYEDSRSELGVYTPTEPKMPPPSHDFDDTRTVDSYRSRGGRELNSSLRRQDRQAQAGSMRDYRGTFMDNLDDVFSSSGKVPDQYGRSQMLSKGIVKEGSGEDILKLAKTKKRKGKPKKKGKGIIATLSRRKKKKPVVEGKRNNSSRNIMESFSEIRLSAIQEQRQKQKTASRQNSMKRNANRGEDANSTTTSEWGIEYSEEYSRPYYVNKRTGERTWTIPPELM